MNIIQIFSTGLKKNKRKLSFREHDTLYSATERQPSPKDGTEAV